MRTGKSRFVIATLVVIASGGALGAAAVAANGVVAATADIEGRNGGHFAHGAEAGADPGPLAVNGAFLGWKPQGSLKDDAALAATAKTVWDEGDPTGGPHTEVQTLFAGMSSETGDGPPGGSASADATWVVLQGRTQDGSVALAYLTNLDWWSGPFTAADSLRLVAVQSLGSPRGLRAIGTLAKAPGDHREVIAMGLAEPGAAIGTFTSPDWHSYSDAEPTFGFHFEALPPVHVSPDRVTLTATLNGKVIQRDALKPSLVSED